MEQILPFIRQLPAGWALRRFEEILTEPVRNGAYKKKKFYGRGQKLISMHELFAYDFISNQEMRRVELSPRELTNSLVKHGDLLFARRSFVLEGSGKCSIVVHPPEDTVFESSIIRARLNPREADPKFYYYLFRSPLGRALIAAIATRTAVSGITGSNLMKLTVPQPPLPTQRKIATILLAYDDLVENNTRRIEILEEMAKAIYQEWFVKFHSSGHENVKMVESDVGSIPEDWTVKQLGELVEIQKGRKPKSLFETPNDRSVPYLLIDGLKNEKHVFTDDEGLPIAHDDDVVMVMDGASSGTVFMGVSGAVGSTLSYFRPKDRQSLSPYMLYLFLQYNQEEIRSNNVGSAIPHANKAFISSMNIILPQEEVNRRIDQVLRPIFVQIRTLKTKNSNLRRTRDILLPKLISGELDVEDMDISTEAFDDG